MRRCTCNCCLCSWWWWRRRWRLLVPPASGRPTWPRARPRRPGQAHLLTLCTQAAAPTAYAHKAHYLQSLVITTLLPLPCRPPACPGRLSGQRPTAQPHACPLSGSVCVWRGGDEGGGVGQRARLGRHSMERPRPAGAGGWGRLPTSRGPGLHAEVMPYACMQLHGS